MKMIRRGKAGGKLKLKLNKKGNLKEKQSFCQRFHCSDVLILLLAGITVTYKLQSAETWSGEVLYKFISPNKTHS